MKNLNSLPDSASSPVERAVCRPLAIAWVMAGALAIPALTGCGPDVAPAADSNAFVLSDTMLSHIQLDTVRLSPVEDVIDLNGHIAADGEKLADIYPIVAGQVLSVSAELGDHVTKGQTLAVIRSSEVADRENQLSDARSDLSMAQKNLKVQQDLFDTKLVSERELMAAQQDLAKAQAQIKRIEETFSIYHFQEGSRYEVTAPMSGYIIDKAITRDVTLPADQTAKIFSIADLNEVWVMADVYESDIARVKEGMPAEVSTLSYPDKVFHGKVDKIFNILDPRTRTMRIRISLPNEGILLKPEMIARIKLSHQEDHSLPAIPSTAVVFDNGKQFVMVFKDRYNVITREVEPDHTTGTTTWITKGLQPGEVIVTKNQLYLYDALNDR